MLRLLALFIALNFLASCAVNPVTGKNELSLVSEAQERNIGAEQYSPSQQSQGGESINKLLTSSFKMVLSSDVFIYFSFATRLSI